MATNNPKILRIGAGALILIFAGTQFVLAQRLKPIPHPVGQPQPGVVAPVQASAGAMGSAAASPWTPLVNQAPSGANGIQIMIQATDGSIWVQAFDGQTWMKLTPDAMGSYINGADSLPGLRPLIPSARWENSRGRLGKSQHLYLRARFRHLGRFGNESLPGLER